MKMYRIFLFILMLSCLILANQPVNAQNSKDQISKEDAKKFKTEYDKAVKADQDAGAGEKGVGCKKCEARYDINGVISSWIDLGEVCWPNRKEKCKQKAKNYLNNLNFLNFNLTTLTICGSNCQGVWYYIDTRVAGLNQTRDDWGWSLLNAKGHCITETKCVYRP